MSSLIAAVAGGLLRAGVAAPPWAGGLVVDRAAVAHAALMLSGFLGTVIAIERAVASRRRWAFAAPFASGIASLFLLAGDARTAAWLWVAAALVFAGINAAMLLRQRAAHTALMLVGAVAWLVGSLLFAVERGDGAVVTWWFGFPVLTIAAERLEMTRLMRRHPAAPASLFGVVLALVAGAGWAVFAPMQGGVVFGVALAALALWLGIFDIARVTVLTRGLSRYMAVCLLAGYGWLGVAGVAWAGTAVGCPERDIALHALGLGFIMSMVMGHAPVILPAVARIRLRFGFWFYIPLVALHASLVLRLLGGIGDPQLRNLGAALNAAALVLFAVTVAGSAVAPRKDGA